ncbi:hypothetical protein GQ55_1G027600 [Panicum hallii var. hallii]|uniref:Uncharacterized protein n=1 Tax=Panicum hallii var. hallii TaxID=1504633 RepID=A0A2T7F1J3_9POAL|nr:hypothetical protein GQ55_1G027600 [Panicum hallii var. hallii]
MIVRPGKKSRTLTLQGNFVMRQDRLYSPKPRAVWTKPKIKGMERLRPRHERSSRRTRNPPPPPSRAPSRLPGGTPRLGGFRAPRRGPSWFCGRGLQVRS